MRSTHIAQLWVCLLFLAIASGGWDTRVASAVLACGLCITGLILAAIPATRSDLANGPTPWRAFGLFVLVLAVGVGQLAINAAFPTPFDTPVDHFRPAGSWDRFATQVELSKLVGLAAAFVIGLSVGRRSSRFDTLQTTLLSAGLAYAVWSILSFVFAGPAPSDDGGEARLFAGLGSANVAAAIFYAVIIVGFRGLVRALFDARIQNVADIEGVRTLARSVPLSLAATFTATAALLLTASRGGALIAAASVLALGVWSYIVRPASDERRQTIGRGTILAAATAVIALAALSGSLLQRTQSRDALADGRFEIYAAHSRAIMEQPWFGYGFGAFHSVNETIMTAANESALRHIGALHSAPLQWLEEGGLVAMASMLAIVGLLFSPIARAAFRGRKTRSWNRAGTVLFAAVGLHSCFEYVLNVYAIAALFSLLLGAWWAFAAASANDRTAP